MKTDQMYLEHVQEAISKIGKCSRFCLTMKLMKELKEFGFSAK